MTGSIRAYARYRKERGWSGGTDGAVRKAIAKRRIVLEPDGRVDFAKADESWRSTTDPPTPNRAAGKRLTAAMSQPPVAAEQQKPLANEPARTDAVSVKPAASKHPPMNPDVEQQTFITARTRREQAEANIAELKYKQAMRELLPANEVKATYYQIGKIYSAARENLPKQLATKLVGKTNLDEIERTLRAEFRAADERISAEIESRFKSAATNPPAENAA